MSNFKSGSGNLDFGSDDDEEDDQDSEAADTGVEPESDSQSRSSADRSPADAGGSSEQSAAEQDASGASTEPAGSEESPNEYPYFVRRNNVGDERDTRLELHVRDKVADREAEFRSELAEQLGTSEVAKTDAREFALLAAFRYPERVAELMEDEGFGALD